MTTGTTNITNTSATLNATVRCDSGESCKWYWEYWRASQPRSTSVKTAAAGPVNGPTGDVNLSINITGLTPNTAYRWVFCGSPNNGGFYGCVGPAGKVGSSTVDPPPDYGTFTTLVRATLAERWNGTSWAVQPTPNPPTPPSSSLWGVSCSSATACIAVGDSGPPATTTGSALAEGWNGASWAIQAVPLPGGSLLSGLFDVSCTSATACTAVGSYDDATGHKTLAERWNGTSWTIESTPNPSGAQQSHLSGVSCTSDTACTTVGYYENAAGVTSALAERWNGTSWTIQTIPIPAGAQRSELYGVSCTAATHCTAVGRYDDATSSKTLAERWNGTSWTIQTTPNNPTGVQRSALVDVSCTSATACTAVGSSGDDSFSSSITLAERWNGTSWTIQQTPNPNGVQRSFLFDVSCTSATACTAVGTSGDDSFSSSTTLAERWNGTSWTIQPTPNLTGFQRNGLEGVSCSSATACTAVGHR